jgi:CRP-like cAMP-binding protein
MDAGERARAKEFLLGIPVFGGLPEGAMERVLALIEQRSHRPGETICTEGQLGREMFVVRSGEVEVWKRAREGARETCLARLRVGDCFGEMSLIDVQPRSATVVARQETELYVITNMDLYRLYQEDLAGYAFFMQNICRELSRRLRKADGVIADFFLRLEEYVKLVVE